MKTPIPDLLETAGGDERVAKACDLTLDAIRKWREAGKVPPKHWSTVAKLSGISIEKVMVAKLLPVPKRKAA